MLDIIVIVVAIFAVAGLVVISRELIRLKKANKDLLDTKIRNNQLEAQSKEYLFEKRRLEEELGEERERNRELLSQKKSSETRLGQIGEHLIPFLKGCKHDPKTLHFMGNPIDYLSFDFDQGIIYFIEVKTANSKPSKRQKIIKNIIKSGRVVYEEMRLNEKGVRSKFVEPDDIVVLDPAESLKPATAKKKTVRKTPTTRRKKKVTAKPEQ